MSNQFIITVHNLTGEIINQTCMESNGLFSAEADDDSIDGTDNTTYTITINSTDEQTLGAGQKEFESKLEEKGVRFVDGVYIQGKRLSTLISPDGIEMARQFCQQSCSYILLEELDDSENITLDLFKLGAIANTPDELTREFNQALIEFIQQYQAPTSQAVSAAAPTGAAESTEESGEKNEKDQEQPEVPLWQCVFGHYEAGDERKKAAIENTIFAYCEARNHKVSFETNPVRALIFHPAHIPSYNIKLELAHWTEIAVPFILRYNPNPTPEAGQHIIKVSVNLREKIENFCRNNELTAPSSDIERESLTEKETAVFIINGYDEEQHNIEQYLIDQGAMLTTGNVYTTPDLVYERTRSAYLHNRKAVGIRSEESNTHWNTAFRLYTALVNALAQNHNNTLAASNNLKDHLTGYQVATGFLGLGRSKTTIAHESVVVEQPEFNHA